MQFLKIGFTGNRYGLTLYQKEQIISILNNSGDNIILSHGDCVGSDTDFHNLCLEYKNLYLNKKIIIHIHPPDNSKLRGFNKGDLIMPEAPYLTRNLNILKNSHILIACPTDKNNEVLRSGTWSTIRQAKKLNLPIFIL